MTNRLAKAEARLKKLNSEGGHIKGAKKTEAQIKQVQSRQTKLKNRLAKLQTRCAATSSSATTTTSGSAGA